MYFIRSKFRFLSHMDTQSVGYLIFIIYFIQKAIFQLFLEILMFHNLNEFYFSILVALNKFIEVFYQILNPFIIFVLKNTILFFQKNTRHNIILFFFKQCTFIISLILMNLFKLISLRKREGYICKIHIEDH
mgnify:CR=1 FL=1